MRGTIPIVAGLWLLMLLGCRAESPAPVSPSPEPPPPPASPDAAPSPVARATERATVTPGAVPTLRLGGLVDPATSDWAGAEPTDTLSMLLQQRLTRSLLTDAGATPGLAAAWSIDGDRALFDLAPTATWSDGRPILAADVADLLLQAREAGELPALAAASALDETRVEVTLVGDECPALVAVAGYPLVDLREWPPARSSGSESVVPLSSDRWRLEPSGLTYTYFKDEETLRAAWARGEINAIVGASRLVEGALAGETRAATEPGPLLAALLFRLPDPLLGDTRLREALAIAVDREALFEAAYGAPPVLLSALYPPAHWAAPAIELELDRDRAAALLDSAGWRDRDGDGIRERQGGERLELTLVLPLSRDARWDALGHELAAQWATVGAAVRPLYVEPFGLQERLHTERWQLALLAYQVDADPDQRALWSRPAPGDLVGEDLNVTGYHDSAVSELMNQGARVPGCDPVDRAGFYRRAWVEILEDTPVWPLFTLPLDVVHRPDAPWPPLVR